MFVIYECAASVLAVLVGAMLLYVACVTLIICIEGGRFAARTWQELVHSVARFRGRNVATESDER